jgi:VanZ family protein
MCIVLVYLFILIWLSLNPWFRPDPGQAIDNIAWDKIDHAAAYCVLSLLLLFPYRHHKPQWLVSLMILLAGALVGVVLEYCQLWFTSTREFSYFDAVANVFGAVLGVFLFCCYRFVIKCSENWT